MKSLEETISVVRPIPSGRRIVKSGISSAICLIRRANTDSEREALTLNDLFVVKFNPEEKCINIEDLIVRHKHIHAVNINYPSNNEIIDAAGPIYAILTVIDHETHRNTQRVICKAFVNPIGV